MRYDLAIIGGGPAGYSAAFEALRHGLLTVIFEKNAVGGTCLNRGCVPTKYLEYAAERLIEARHSARYGINLGVVRLEPSAIFQGMGQVVSQLRSELEKALSQDGITLVNGTASIVEAHTVVCGGMEYTCENILIATGSQPASPFVPGALTSDELLRLDRIPDSMTIVGGGVVAVEFAHIFSALGTKVTVCIRSGRLLRGWDRELARGVTQILKDQGVEIKTNCDMERLKESGDEVVLSAIGRVPVTQGVFAGQHGEGLFRGIHAGPDGQTAIPNIYAAGDVVEGSTQLAHVAMDQGRRAVRAISREALPPAPSIVRCIYVKPEIAVAGFSEEEAKALGIYAVSAKHVMYSNARVLIAGGGRSFAKLVADADRGTLIGAQLMCERAGDMISELSLAMNTGLTIGELLHSVRPHPSFSEAVTEALMELHRKL